MWTRILVCFLLLPAIVKAQGPIDGYMKAKGEGDLALGFSLSGASDFLDGEGQAVDLGFNARMGSLFVAYGLHERINLVASVPYVITDNSSGLQDGQVFAKALISRFSLGGSEQSNAGSIDILGAFGIQAPLSRYEVVANGAAPIGSAVQSPRIFRLDDYWIQLQV